MSPRAPKPPQPYVGPCPACDFAAILLLDGVPQEPCWHCEPDAYRAWKEQQS